MVCWELTDELLALEVCTTDLETPVVHGEGDDWFSERLQEYHHRLRCTVNTHSWRRGVSLVQPVSYCNN